MKTITKRSLDELAKEMPVLSEMDLRGMVGGTGTFTEEEFWSMYITNEWEGGQVEGWGSLGKSFDSVSMISGEIYIDGKNKDGELAPDFLEDEDTGFQDDPFATDSGFSGDSGILDDNDYQLEALISQLSTEERQLLDEYNVNIRVVYDKEKSGGRFNDATNVITLYSYNLESLRSELIHLKQKDLGAIENGNPNYSNSEFQETIVSDLLQYCSGGGSHYHIGNKNIVLWMEDVTNGGDMTKPLNLDLFYDKIDEYFNEYQTYYHQMGEETNDPDFKRFGSEPNPNYKWEWEKILKFAGFIVP